MNVTDPPRIDAHQHFWQLADRRGHWPPPALAAIHRDFEPADFEPLRVRAGIDGSVLVQSLPTEAETHHLLRLASRHDVVWGVVGWVDMKAADAPARIDALGGDGKLKGLRPMLQDLPEDDWIADRAVDPAARRMADRGLVFDALVLPRHLPALEAFARRHPGLRIVVDHAAKPPLASGDLGAWQSHIERLAELPHVTCKVSGLLTEAGPHANAETLRPCVDVLWRAFGPDRLLWGSDWPVLRLAGDYQHWFDMSRALIRSLDPVVSDRVMHAVFGGNAMRVYRLADTRRPASSAAR